MVHQVVDGEVARRGVLRDQRIAVERQRCLGSGEDAAEVLVLLVEHLLHLLPDDRVRRCPSPVRHPPVVRIVRDRAGS